MKRCYLSPIIGIGTEDDPFRPMVAIYGVAWSAQIATGDDGRPIQSVAVVEVNADDFSALDADANLTNVTV